MLHPSSLPGKYGIGDLGGEAFKFVDFLVASGQKYWQILPLGPTGYGNSPYSAYSAFAGNTLLISIEKIVSDKLLPESFVENAPQFPTETVDFDKVLEWKTETLSSAFEAFKADPNSAFKDEFEYFCRENAWWLDDYAIFRAVKASHDTKRR